MDTLPTTHTYTITWNMYPFGYVAKNREIINIWFLSWINFVYWAYNYKHDMQKNTNCFSNHYFLLWNAKKITLRCKAKPCTGFYTFYSCLTLLTILATAFLTGFRKVVYSVKPQLFVYSVGCSNRSSCLFCRLYSSFPNKVFCKAALELLQLRYFSLFYTSLLAVPSMDEPRIAYTHVQNLKDG